MRLAAIMLALLLTLALVGHWVQAGTAKMLRELPVACQEDDPCWDCQTMGNHICGTTP